MDESNDPLHCGSCFVSCLPGSGCCDGQCTDFATDRNNCGSCGLQCAINETCVAGSCIPQVTLDVACNRYTGCADGIGGLLPYDYFPPGATTTFLSNNVVKIDLYSTSTPADFDRLYPMYSSFGVITGAPISSMVPQLPDFTRWPLLYYSGSIDGIVGTYGAAGSYEDHYHQINRANLTFLYGHRSHRYDATGCGYSTTGLPRKAFNYVICRGAAAP